MSDYSIKLNPVYSCPTSDIPKEIKLPKNCKLSWHQVETYKAINNPDVDVVINTAMTGDGKSLAADLAVLFGESVALKMYPTNELARDQEIQTKQYDRLFELEDNLQIKLISSQDLEVSLFCHFPSLSSNK
jgi:CRISPR-associated endonuclease/helicase Cas3